MPYSTSEYPSLSVDDVDSVDDNIFITVETTISGEGEFELLVYSVREQLVLVYHKNVINICIMITSLSNYYAQNF